MFELNKIIDEFLNQEDYMNNLENKDLKDFMEFIFLLNVRWSSFSKLELKNNYDEENSIEGIYKKIHEELMICPDFEKKNKGKDKKHIVRDIICYIDNKLNKFPLFFSKEKLNYCYLKPIISAIIYNCVLEDKKVLKLVKDDYILDYPKFVMNIESIENYCERYIKNSEEFNDQDIVFIDYIIEVIWSKNKIKSLQKSFDNYSENKIKRNKLKLINVLDVKSFLEDASYMSLKIFDVYKYKFLDANSYNIFLKKDIENLNKTILNFLDYFIYKFSSMIEVNDTLKSITSTALNKIEKNNLFLEKFLKESIDILVLEEKYKRLQVIIEVIGFFEDFILMEQAINGKVDIIKHIKSIIPISDLSKSNFRSIISIFSNLEKKINKLRKEFEKNEKDYDMREKEVVRIITEEYLSFFEEYKEDLLTVNFDAEIQKLELLCENIENEKSRKVKSKIIKYINGATDLAGIFKYQSIAEYIFENERINNMSWRQIYAEVDSIDIICENIIVEFPVEGYSSFIKSKIEDINKSDNLCELYGNVIEVSDTCDFSKGMNIYLKEAELLREYLTSFIKEQICIEYSLDSFHIENNFYLGNIENENSIIYIYFMNIEKKDYNEKTESKCLFYDFINYYSDDIEEEVQFKLDIFRDFFLKTNKSPVDEFLKYIGGNSEYVESDECFSEIILLSKVKNIRENIIKKG